MADITISGSTVGFSSIQNNAAEAMEQGATYPGKIFFTKDGNIVLGGRIFGVSIRTDKTEDEALQMADEYSKVLFFTSDKQTIVLNKKKYGVDGDTITALQNAISALQAADTTLQGNIDAEATRAKTAESTEVSDRKAADTTLQNNINTEASERKSADADLQGQITTNKNNITTLTETVENDAKVKAEALSDLDIRTSSLEAMKGKTSKPLTFGTKTFDGSTAQEITAADLGISSAFQLIGNCSLEITITPKFTPDAIGDVTGMTDGDFARVGNTLYIYHNSAWHDITGINDYTNYTPTFDDGTAGQHYGIVKYLNADGDEQIQAIYLVNYKTPDESFDPQKGWVFTDKNNKEWYFGADLLWHEYGDSGSYALKANTYTKTQVDDLALHSIIQQSYGVELENNAGTVTDTITPATTSQAGVMTPDMLSKLNDTYSTSEIDTKVNAKYTKPSGGIPSTDFDPSTQINVALAQSALQSVSVNGTALTVINKGVNIPLAVAGSTDGAMSKTDKTNLDNCVSAVSTMGNILIWE